MKRVHALAGVIPAAVAVVTPLATAATAHAATAAPGAKTVSAHPLAVPLTSGKECDGDVCIQVFGTGNHVSKVTEWITHNTDRADAFFIFAVGPAGSGLWKSAEVGAFKGTKSHTWVGSCSWPGSFSSRTAIVASAEDTTGNPTVTVYGSTFTGRHRCGFI